MVDDAVHIRVRFFPSSLEVKEFTLTIMLCVRACVFEGRKIG